MVSPGVYAILLTQTLDAFGTMVVLPTLPFYMMELGATAFTISLLGSAYNLAQMLCSPTLGSLSDRVGRKRVMVLGLTAQAICNGAMSFASSIPALIMARMAVGVALSTGPVEMAYIMDFIGDEKELSRVLALQRVMTSAGALTGPLVARFFDQAEFPALVRGLVCINILNLVIGISLWKDAPPRENTSSDSAEGPLNTLDNDAGFWGPVRWMFTNPATGLLLAASFVYTVGCQLSDGPEIVFFKEHFGYGKGEVANFFMITSISSLFSAVIIPSMICNFGGLGVATAGCLGSCAMVLVLVLLPGTPEVPYVFGATVGLFGSMFGVGFMTVARKKCHKSMLGAMLGMQSSFNGFAGTVGPPLGGYLYGLNPFIPYVSNSLLAGLAAFVFTLLPSAAPESTPIQELKKPLRRVSTFGMPIFPDKNFIMQLNANLLRIEQDPDLSEFYQKAKESINDTNPRSSLRQTGIYSVATIAGGMARVVAAAERREEHDGMPRPYSVDAGLGEPDVLRREHLESAHSA